MDHPLPLQSAAWLSSNRLDQLDQLDHLAQLDDPQSMDHLDRLEHLDVSSHHRSDPCEIDESSESDRPNQWVRADSTSSSRSTLLSDMSADMPVDVAVEDDKSVGPASPSDMQWEVVRPSSRAHPHGHSHDDRDQDYSHDSQDTLYPPKAEPDEYDFCLEDVQPAPPPAATKRPRGRPRKPSISSATAMAGSAAAASASKIAKARSKTGCTTCRRRKKKCDETKPVCLNCEKNAVVCEGYKEKHVWKSGRERAQDELLKTQPPLDITLQPIFMGMEGREDRLIWNYYLDHVSNVFTADFGRDNVFRTTVVPLATNHQAMMHSVLSLASRHINFDSQHVQKLLRRSSKVTPESLQNRGSHHNSEALTRLSHGMYHNISISMNNSNSAQWKTPDALAARYSQMLFLVLESLAEGQHDGSQRPHYEFFLYMLERFPPVEPEFYSFISEIFYYHIYADDLLYCPLQQKARLVVGDWVPAMPLAPARLIGICDGLFNYLSQITSIRNRIRARVQSGADPRVDYESLYRASDIECQIHDWKPEWAPSDSRNRATLLYQQMAWLYLRTTVYPPSPSQTSQVSQVSQVSQMSQTQLRADNESAIQSGSTTCASSPVPHIANIAQIEAMIPAANNFSNPRRHSIANPSLASGSRPFLPKFVSFAEHDTTETFEPFEAFGSFDPEAGEVAAGTGARTGAAAGNEYDDSQNGADSDRASPPPIRRPFNHESAVSVAVKEALALLESFKADDQCQTLLLVPCVVVGTSCYSPTDQERIRTAIRAVHAYTGLRHTELALELLNKVWQLMEQGDFLGAWDWQTVAFNLGIQHLF